MNETIVFRDTPEVSTLFVTGDFIPLGFSETNLAAGKLDEVFGSVLPEIQKSDLAVTNLETALTRSGEAIRKCGPNLRSDPASLQGIVDAGFRLFALANNHSRDWGDEAFLETMRHITDAGADFVGGGRNLADASKPFRTLLNGMRISIFNATMTQPCCATTTAPGANPLRPAPLAAQIAAEKSNADFILAIIHDGKEHLPFPSRRIRDNYRAFIDAGADAVIGHHPHISQGFERYHGGFIAYSLGNFHFPARDKSTAPGFWNRAYSVRLHIDAEGVCAVDLLPHYNDPRTDTIHLMTGADRAAFLDELEKLNRILADDAAGDLYFTAAGFHFSPYYFKRFTGALAEKNPDDQFYFAHALETEEHLDVLLAVTAATAAGTPPQAPADLDYFLRRD